MKTAVERFLSYIKIDTTSKEAAGTYPSTPAQLELAEQLKTEMIELGLSDVELDEYGYVTGTVPANAKGFPVIGLISHMDTSDAVPGGPISLEFRVYTGGDIVQKSGAVIRAAEYPMLKELEGQTLILTDGQTLLGADDKAGIAEIMTAAERLIAEDAPAHGTIRIAFTPDEEIGEGTKYFDVEKFGAELAYTVDGGALGELEYETFNAAMAEIRITGRNIHPGEAKGKMVNAASIGAAFQSMLPAEECPECTEGREGFYHLFSFTGDVEKSHLRYLLRDHDTERFEARKTTILKTAAALNEIWGEGTVEVEIRDQYRNMGCIIEQHMELITHAVDAFRAAGIREKIQPIRGGTDGAALSFRGLPCPNLSTGGYFFHSKAELIPEEALGKMTEVLVKLVCSFGSGAERK